MQTQRRKAVWIAVFTLGSLGLLIDFVGLVVLIGTILGLASSAGNSLANWLNIALLGFLACVLAALLVLAVVMLRKVLLSVASH